MVLANGSVINANASSNADLHKALKGGSGNFGVVTRYDVTTLPNVPIYGGQRVYDYHLYADVVLETVVDFASADRSQGDDALIVLFVASGDNITLSTAQVNTQGIKDSTSFAKLTALPPVVDSMATMSMADFAAASINPAGFR